MLVSLCRLKIEIDKDVTMMNDEDDSKRSDQLSISRYLLIIIYNLFD